MSQLIASIACFTLFILNANGLQLGLPSVSENEIIKEVPVLPAVVKELVLESPPNQSPGDGDLGSNIYKTAAVSSDSQVCSKIGRENLQNGGNAVTAACAVSLCLGLTNAHSTGVGGGFFMTIYDKKSKKVGVIDARETAPGAATQNMLQNKTKGGMVAVPGFLKGLQAAYKLYGHNSNSTWKDLFTPTIDMATKGYEINLELANALQTNRDKIEKEDSMKMYWLHNSHLPRNRGLKGQGQIIRNLALANTLEIIANSPTNTADALYNGNLTDGFIQDLKSKNSIITRDDLANYTVKLSNRNQVANLRNNMTIYNGGGPSAGPILKFITKLMDETIEKCTEKDVVDIDCSYQLFTESCKFGFCYRNKMGDPYNTSSTGANVQNIVTQLLEEDFIKSVSQRINLKHTENPLYYCDNQSYQQQADFGAAHVSVIDKDGMAVSMTSTINNAFGAVFMSESTGILLNNEMNAFTSPSKTGYGLPANKNNFIEPGKRPLSSMCPTIIVNNTDDNVVLVIGAGAGGNRIITANLFTIYWHLYPKKSLEESISQPRLHHQLYAETIRLEEGFSMASCVNLTLKRHILEEDIKKFGASVVGIARLTNGSLEAVADHRRHGGSDGY